MRIKETIDVSLPSSEEIQTPEDVVVVVDSTGTALAMRPAVSARARGVSKADSGPVASRSIDIPIVRHNGDVPGVLCRVARGSDPRGAVATRGREGLRAIEDVARFVVHDMNNLLTVISTNLRLLECESDTERRGAIVGKMQHAIERGALLSRQLLEAARPRPVSIGGFVGGSRLAALVGTLDRAIRPDITVRTDIASDLWDFEAEPEELYFALLNLCRNAADAIPDGGAITVVARNIKPCAGGHRGFVEIAVADEGDGMTEEVLSQAFTPYFTTKVAGGGTGLGLAQVQRFVEARGGAVDIKSKPGFGTLVRLCLPRVADATVSVSPAGTEIA